MLVRILKGNYVLTTECVIGLTLQHQSFAFSLISQKIFHLRKENPSWIRTLFISYTFEYSYKATEKNSIIDFV